MLLSSSPLKYAVLRQFLDAVGYAHIKIFCHTVVTSREQPLNKEELVGCLQQRVDQLTASNVAYIGIENGIHQQHDICYVTYGILQNGKTVFTQTVKSRVDFDIRAESLAGYLATCDPKFTTYGAYLQSKSPTTNAKDWTGMRGIQIRDALQGRTAFCKFLLRHFTRSRAKTV